MQPSHGMPSRNTGIRTAIKKPLKYVYERMLRPVTHRATERFYDHQSARRLMALVEGAQYAEQHMNGALATPHKRVVLIAGLQAVQMDGLYAEFGVWSGRTINVIADFVGPDKTVHGFDSFKGLPEAWNTYRKGSFDMSGALPQVRPNVRLHAGWFQDTVPQFAAEHANEPAAFLHVDCDLYSSTRSVLDALGDRLRPGSVIVFDEYFNYPGWRDHEYKAFQELVASRSLRYRYLAYNTREWNAAVQIIA